jgi:RimJ/RimL family protein N-acetyltransferase
MQAFGSPAYSGCMASAATPQDLIDPGAMLAATHELDDGSRVRLRLTRPTDLAKIEAFLQGLSADARARRFLSATPTVPDSVVRRFAFYDPRERLTLAATLPSDGIERIVGIADVALLATGLAEIGIVIADEFQSRGLGSLLSESVASLAIHRAATHLKAEMRDDNEQMLHLMQRLGRTVRSVEDGRVVVYTRLPASRRRHAA